MLVTAAQAGELVGRHERIARLHIANKSLPAQKKGNSWQIDTDDLDRIPGWSVNREKLALLEILVGRTSEGILARIERLERDVHLLKLENQELRKRQRDMPLPVVSTALPVEPDRSPGQCHGLLSPLPVFLQF
jgi:hypothetical protein